MAQRLLEDFSTGLPVHFIGLPTSDLFMMGRLETATNTTHTRSRAFKVKDFGLSTCIGVSNVGNAVTQFGSGDPLQIASWGVCTYHAGTVTDVKTSHCCELVN
ncbi:hypothetical protein AAE478_010543 [Parahypoxylon ruwenzoriense]